MRRVVTGTDAEGRSYIVSDGPAELHPTPTHIDLWAFETPPQLPLDGSRPETTRFWPPPGGMRVSVTCFPPEEAREKGVTPEQFREQWDVIENGMKAMESRYPDFIEKSGREIGEDGVYHGVRKFDTVDIGYVIEGQVTYQTDDGEITRLYPGDVIIQNGVRHVFINEDPSKPSKALWITYGAIPADE